MKQAQQQARQAKLQDIATTFHLLFRQHSIMQAWHSMAQRAKQEQAQLQQEAAEQQLDEAKWSTAVQFHALYVKHSFWRWWVQATLHGRAAKDLELEHQARQQSIQRFVKASFVLTRDMQLMNQ